MQELCDDMHKCDFENFIKGMLRLCKSENPKCAARCCKLLFDTKISYCEVQVMLREELFEHDFFSRVM